MSANVAGRHRGLKPVVRWCMKPAVEWGSAKEKRTGNAALTLARLVPSFLLPLPLALVGCIDREEPIERGATGRLVPTPTAGDMERGGTAGG